MRVVFMGTPHAAVPSLRTLADQFEVVAVYTRVDKPKGRGRQLAQSPVKEAALGLGLDVMQPTTLRGGAQAAALDELRPDAIVVVAYGMILPADVLAVPRLGCVNVHFSLLPRWRGAAPVEHAIMASDSETGVTTMLMDAGLDTGPMLLTATTPIDDDDTTGTITARLADRGADLLADSLRGLDRETLTPISQPDEGVTLAPKITAEDALLDFARPAAELWRRVRALDPSPGAYTTLGGKRMKVWGARVVPGDGSPGRIAAAGDEGIDVQTPQERLRLESVQTEGKRRMSAAEFLRGRPVAVGDIIGE